MEQLIGSFELAIRDDGVAVATLNRPPVNAMSISVYEDLGRLADVCESASGIRALVLAARPDARAWCGGADLNDFAGITPEERKARYAYINAALPRFYRLERPVIAAINAPAIGVGMILAALCDMRIAADTAEFACPEIDYGLVAGGAALFALANMPEAKIREMLFTGDRFTARELEPTGFFNYVVPAGDVLERAMALATRAASKSLPAIRARKIASSQIEGRSWTQAYLDAQELSGKLTAGGDGQEGVRAFLEGRQASYKDS